MNERQGVNLGKKAFICNGIYSWLAQEMRQAPQMEAQMSLR